MANPMKNFARILLLVPGIIWGISFISVEFVLIDVPPITLTLLRSSISVTMLLTLCYFFGARLPKSFKEYLPFFILAMFNLTIPFALGAWAQTHIEAGLASIYLAAMPLFTVILAAVWVADERLTFWKAIGVVCGLTGIIVLIGPSAFSGIGINVIAQIAILTSSLLYAIGAILTRVIYTMQPEDLSGFPLLLRITTSQFLMSIVALVPASLLFEDPLSLQISAQSFWHLLFLGIGVTSLATITYFFLIEQLGAGTASMTIYLIPIAGVIAGVLVLNEQFRSEMGIALILILGGIAITNLGDRFAMGGKP